MPADVRDDAGGLTPRERAERAAGLGRALVLVGFALVAGTYVRALAFTPMEVTQGLAQKIFYVHAPSAWVAFLAFGVVAVCSLLYLALKHPHLDLLAASSAEVGVVFTTVVLITGPIWGKPIWGTWWTWDARLTLTLFLWFIYLGYLVLRTAVPEPERRARFSAVVGILGALLIPFIHVSVVLFRTLHPQPILIKASRPSLPGSMLITLLGSLAVFTFLYVAFLVQRFALARLEEAQLAEREAEGGGA